MEKKENGANRCIWAQWRRGDWFILLLYVRCAKELVFANVHGGVDSPILLSGKKEEITVLVWLSM